jgi:phosphoenolpyruvate synthase/pyruvate phosphate dikinase
MKKIIKTPYQRVKEWRERNKEKRKAQIIVFVAVRNGTLKQLVCEVCGSEKSEAHHENYTMPLKIMWLCKEHHIIADFNRRHKEKSVK